jgi:HD superfamily phosphohydrolase
MNRWNLPELEESGLGIIRIPPQTDVRISRRVGRLIDTSPFRRLSNISQLGLVSQVYPGAHHSRAEHSLGVYRLATKYLRVLQHDKTFADSISQIHAETFLVAALLHDVAHWPFCHPIEDMRLPQIDTHEKLAGPILFGEGISQCLTEDWSISPRDVADLLSDPPRHADADPEISVARALLASLLSGPIDIDKMDYLERDSLHAGVPYGCNFDKSRLIESLCIDPVKKRLAISDKGRTAAEMMVFARYVMFSEVYWHHAVRSATAMLQRAFYNFMIPAKLGSEAWVDQATLRRWQQMDESGMVNEMQRVAAGTSSHPLIDGLFGQRRRLFKRIAQFNCQEHEELHAAISHQPYPELCRLSRELAEQISSLTGQHVGGDQLLVDASPLKLEVQFKLTVRNQNGEFAPLSSLSPVVSTLATRQFDAVVKRVRIFIAPEHRDAVSRLDLPALLAELVDTSSSESTRTID